MGESGLSPKPLAAKSPEFQVVGIEFSPLTADNKRLQCTQKGLGAELIRAEATFFPDLRC
jgi:hypothetical protein